MRNERFLGRLSAVALLALLVSGGSPDLTTIHAQTVPLLVQPADLKYQGAFRVPSAGTVAFPDGYDFGGQMLAFDSARNALFLGGYNAGIGEISIPTPVYSTTLSGLPTSTVVQPMIDPSEGKATEISKTYGPTASSAMFVYGGQLIGAVSTYYDANYLQMLSHYSRPTDLTNTGNVRGLYQLGSLGTGNGGRVSGWMALVPTEWQSSLGGPALAGQCCIPIITRTSWGPSAFSFDPANLGSISPTPANPLIYYPNDHPWGTMEQTDPVWNGSTVIGGMVLPSGTRTLLYFGRHGIGDFCYGIGGGSPTDPTTEHCYDLEDSSKGMHGYPYVYQVTAYDVLDMAAVKSGAKNPWEIRPYAHWEVKFPVVAPQTFIRGATYDPTTGRIFVSQAFADGAKPVMHVFTIGGAGYDLTAHSVSPPKNVRVVR